MKSHQISKMKKLLSFFLALATVLALTVAMVPANKISAAGLTLTMPSNDGKTDNTSYTIGAGTEDEVNVICKFITKGRPNRNGNTHVQKYIVIHATDNPNASAGAASHNSYLRTGSGLTTSFAYVVGSDGIYQNLPDLEHSGHTGTNSLLTNITNDNAIGIETCDAGIPYSGDYDHWDKNIKWNTAEMDAWYENYFKQRVGYLSILVATLCIRYDFNPYTQVVQHYDVYGKECPREMRYVFGTNGTASRADGTYWKILREKIITYYNAYGGTYTGYTTGKYVASASLPVFQSADRNSSTLTTIPQKTAFQVTEVNGEFGKVTYGSKTGWIYFQNGAICQDVKGSDGEYDDGTGIYRFNEGYNTDGTMDTMNFRSGASTSGTTILTTIPRDGKTTIAVTETSGSWGKALYNGYTGWVNVSSSYATRISKLVLTAPVLTAPAEVKGGGSFTVSWDDVPGAGHYKVKAVLADNETSVLKQIDVTRDLSVTIDNAPGGKTVKVGVATETLQGEKWAYVNVVITNSYFDINDSTISADDGYILGVKENVTGSVLKSKFNNNVNIVDKNGVVITSGYAGTGCKVQSLDNGAIAAEYVIIVSGDIDGDGKVTINDYVTVKASLKTAVSTLDAAQTIAADTTNNKIISVTDYLMIKRHVAKTYNLYA